MRIFLCELRLFAYTLRYHPRNGLQTLSPEHRRNIFLERKRYLRRLLQDTPWWADGHIELGSTEIELQLLSEGRRDARDLGTLEISAKAAEVLLADARSEKAESQMLQVKYLKAMLAFFSGNYESALETYAEVLAPGNAPLVPARTAVVVLEHAGGAALLLGLKDLAIRYFSAIPVAQRSSETLAALEHLMRAQQDVT